MLVDKPARTAHFAAEWVSGFETASDSFLRMSKETRRLDTTPVRIRCSNGSEHKKSLLDLHVGWCADGCFRYLECSVYDDLRPSGTLLNKNRPPQCGLKHERH